MKTISIKFVCFPKKWDYKRNLIFNILTNHFYVVFNDKKPDYLFCSVFPPYYDYLNYKNSVRILISGENFIPDFNYVDYAISSYPLSLLDRHFRLPYFMWVDYEKAIKLESPFYNRVYDKSFFANFIASHDSENNLRSLFVSLLSRYKRIECVGSFMNNMPNGYSVNRDNKIDFMKRCKFTICFESTKHDGFVTEKILDAFYAGTIPIYYGSSDIKTIFNKDAFIDVSDFKNIEEAIDKIKEIDNNDDLYQKIIKAPVFAQDNYVSTTIKNLSDFIINIFNQPLEKSFRRSKVYSPNYYENWIIKKQRKKKIFWK